MCNFVSWIEYKGKNYFLENKDLVTKQGKKLLEDEYKNDIEGHGAIEHYYPELKGKGVHKECEDFSTPNNFPTEIVSALKEGRLSNIGIEVDILNTKGKQAYWKIENPAKAKYWKIENSARSEYYKIVDPAWDEYKKIRNHAYHNIVIQEKYRNKNWE